MTQLQGKDGQLAAANMEIVDLKKQLGAKPAPKEGWQETATGARITLASDILFAAGKATLSQSGSARLRQVAAAIKTSYPGARVRVYGFTDNDPIKKRTTWTSRRTGRWR